MATSPPRTRRLISAVIAGTAMLSLVAATTLHANGAPRTQTASSTRIPGMPDRYTCFSLLDTEHRLQVAVQVSELHGNLILTVSTDTKEGSRWAPYLFYFKPTSVSYPTDYRGGTIAVNSVRWDRIGTSTHQLKAKGNWPNTGPGHLRRYNEFVIAGNIMAERWKNGKKTNAYVIHNAIAMKIRVSHNGTNIDSTVKPELLDVYETVGRKEKPKDPPGFEVIQQTGGRVLRFNASCSD